MPDHPNLTAALAAAQAEYPRIEKTSVNPHFKSHYTDLGDGMGLIRPVLAKHGIAYTQTFHVVDGTLLLRTSLRHGSEEIASDLPILQPPKPQDFVSLTTYYRRVSLFSIAGITPANEDDDGNVANDVATTQAPPRQTRQPPAKPKVVETPEQAVARADQEQKDRDPWKLNGLPVEQLVDSMIVAINAFSWPDVQAAMATYKGRLQLTDAEKERVNAAYLARRDEVRQQALPMAG